jgi:hypothetical protein
MFVQDDWYHLYQIQGKNILEVLNYFNIFQSGKIDPLNFYRPLSTKLYFYFARHFFELNYSCYQAVNFLLFFLISYFVFKLAKKLVGQKKALLTTFFYIFSVSHFTLFSYITKIEDLLFALFGFLSILALIKKRMKSALLFFIFSLMCRESALIIPLAISGYLFFLKRKKVKGITKLIFPYLIIVLTYFIARAFIYGWPKDKEVYQIALVGPHIAINVLKYLQWNLNITGLVKGNSALALLNLLTLAGFFGILAIGLIRQIRQIRPIKNSKKYKFLLFSIFWWGIFLAPVLFFKNHRDPWNLVVACFGTSLFLSQVTPQLSKLNRKVFFSLYVLSYILGFYFYANNHWTITRSRILKQTYAEVKNQCSNKVITISASNKKKLDELKHSWYYDLGPRVLCNNKKIEVRYLGK